MYPCKSCRSLYVYKNGTLRGNLWHLIPFSNCPTSRFEYFKYLQAAKAGRMESTCGAGTRMPVSISTRRAPLLTHATPYAYGSERPARAPAAPARTDNARVPPARRASPAAPRPSGFMPQHSCAARKRRLLSRLWQRALLCADGAHSPLTRVWMACVCWARACA